MSYRRRCALLAAATFATFALSQRTARADTYTWSGAVSSDFFAGGNYIGGGSPPAGASDVLFGAVGAGGSLMPTLTGDSSLTTAIFDVGAPNYTFNGAAGGIEFDHRNDPINDLNGDIIVNNSTNTQVFTNFANLRLTGQISANNGNLVINAPIWIGSKDTSSTAYTAVSGAHDIYFNVDPAFNAAGSLTGGAWASATIGTAGYNNQRGRFLNTNSSGRVYVGDIGNTYRGSFLLTSNVGGKVRLTTNNSLGDPGANNNDSIVILGGNGGTDPTAGNSTLELDGSHAAGGGISVGRGIIWVDGRSGTTANVPHIENIAGNNTFGVNHADWNTGWNNLGTLVSGRTATGVNAGNINFQSDSGTITFTGGPLYNDSAAGSFPWTIQLSGAGNGVFKNQVTNYQPDTNPGWNVVMNGTGTWTLANAVNDYAGATTINQGTYKIATGATHSGGFSYTVNGGSLVVDGNLTTSSVLMSKVGAVGPVLSGTGNVHSDVFASGASINPGDGGVGVLTMNTLTFDDPGNSGGTPSALNIDLGATGVDRVNLSNSDGLQFLGGAGSVLVNPTNLGSVVNGTYTLVDYNGSALNAGSFSSFSLTSTSLGGLTLSLVNDTVGTSVDLVVTGGIGLNTQWKLDTDGNWTDAAKWNPSTPNGQDQIANFGSVISSPRTVTLNSTSPAQTVGVMNFSPTGTDGTYYTIAGTGTVIINSSTGTGTINNASGENVIGTGSLTLQLASNTNVNVNNGTDTLTIGAKIAGTGGLNKIGPGLLVLSSSNSFSGGATLSAGTLQISDDSQLGAASSSLTFAGGTLLAGTDVTLGAARPIVVGATGGTIDTGTNTMTVAGTTSGTGILTKVGNGTLAFNASDTLSGLVLNGGTLAGSGAVTVNSTGTFDLRNGTVAVPLNGTGGVNINTGTVTYTGNNGYTGNTTLASGALVASSNTALGGTTSNLVFAGGTLQPAGDLTLPNTRGVILNSNTSILYNNHVVTINGPVSGAGGISLNEAGATLVLGGSNSFTGVGTITTGILRVTNSNAMLNTGTLDGGASTGVLQLAGNITYSAPIIMRARQQASNSIENFSGNNTLTSAITLISQGGSYNFGSDSGKLTIGAGPTSIGFNYPVGKTFKLLNIRGAGDMEFAGSVQIGNPASPADQSELFINHLGTGNLTFSGSQNYNIETLSIFGGGTLTLSSTFGNTNTNFPLFINGGGVIQLANNSTLDLSNATGLMVAGVVPLVKPVYGSGTIKGNVSATPGFFNFYPFGTVISPGGTPQTGSDGAPAPGAIVLPGSGILTFNNNVDLSNGALYQWSIGSLSTAGAGTNYDQIAIGGAAVLGGTSSISLDFSQLAAGSTPVVDPSVGGTDPFWTTGHQWKIVDITGAGTNSTVLASITGFNNDSGPAYFKQTLGTGADAGDVFLNYAVSIKGDANRDGKVNAIDFNTLATNFGANVQSWSLGDFNGSGTVDSADFTLLAMNFGQTSVAPAPSLGSLVPEPTSLGLLGAAAVLGMRRRRSGK